MLFKQKWTPINMKNIVVATLIIILAVGVFYIFSSRENSNEPLPQTSTPQPTVNDVPQTSVIAENLDTPWAIAFLPDQSMLVTERRGRIRVVNSDGQLEAQPVAELNQVEEIGEGGLLGITTHPNFSTNNYIYLYYTYMESGGNTLNRVARMTFKDRQLTDEQIIVDRIPGASNHNGGRIKFGPDGYLYITTGDAQNPSQAQDINSLAGKILRVDENGNPAGGNPFGNRVYSYGHRNPQGLTWDGN